MTAARLGYIGSDTEFGCGKPASAFQRGPDAERARLTQAECMIVVGTDGSASALAAERFAIELAAARGEPLLFVTAWRELRGDLGLPLRALIPDVVDIERDWAGETVEAAAARAREAGVEVETETRHGKPAHEICSVAREQGARMIVVGSTGWSAIPLGSVSAEVLHRAPCPVLVVGVTETADAAEADDGEHPGAAD